ncbi:hypothetical protein [Persicirhabdus sediminis]|uniref:hypothetical protein n=1 Tax=Persicirhabdus sediminis TaxID=454144 RepID=UPI001F1E70F0|nr:hypothetical protein [Persicirhabdus sediminis]
MIDPATARFAGFFLARVSATAPLVMQVAGQRADLLAEVGIIYRAVKSELESAVCYSLAYPASVWGNISPASL